MLIHFYQFFEKLKASPARRDRLIQIATGASALVNLGLWIFLYWSFRRIGGAGTNLENIPLHYNIFFGFDWLGDWRLAFTLPLAGLLILLVNAVLSFWLYSRTYLLSYFLSMTALLFQIFIAISSLLIILINS
jgi:hypothetical protein